MGVNSTKCELITLNYSGILLSPFQFFSFERFEDEDALSKLFFSLLSAKPGFDRATFSWGLGKIDQKMQKQRYTPIYHPTAGIKKGKLITEAQFRQEWNVTFDKNYKKQDFEYKPAERAAALEFDLLCYKTLVCFSHKSKDEKILEKAQELNVKAYEDLLASFFSKVFLEEGKKIQKTFNALQKEKVDIAFVQEASKVFLQALAKKEDYHIVHQHKTDSVILLRKKTFGGAITNEWESKLEAKQPGLLKDLNWNGDTTICVYRNLFLVSAHLSSKKDKNSEQVQTMWKHIEIIRKVFPEKIFIMGIDANTFLNKCPQGFSVYPNHIDDYTTIKRRTWMQPQANKAQQLAQTCRDHIVMLSSIETSKAQVTTITKSPKYKDNMIPSNEHPYDHFVVNASVDIEID